MNVVLAGRVLPKGQTFQIVQGDITEEETDAIVNAANSRLQHGAGVAGAIARQGGPSIQRESTAWVRAHGPVSYSQPAWTSGGLLAAKYVIHAVGPVWGEGEEDVRLSAAVQGSLAVADRLRCTSVALPALSTGVFRFPKQRAAQVTFSGIEKYFSENPSSIRLVRLVLFDQPTVDAFVAEWQRHDAPGEDRGQPKR